MPIKRIRTIVEGKVQKVNYRDVIQEIARSLGITGYIKNLEDGNVEIVAEGEGKKIKEFLKKIKIREKYINVEKITVKFEEPTGEFKTFKIAYGRIEDELGERMVAGMNYMGDMNKNIEKVNENVMKVGDNVMKVNENVIRVGSKIDKLGNETNQNFKIMDKRYGKISDKIDKMANKLSNAILKGFKLLAKSRTKF